MAFGSAAAIMVIIFALKYKGKPVKTKPNKKPIQG